MSTDYKYNKKPDKDFINELRDHIEPEFNDIRKLDESNPHELAMKFNMIKRNPPDPDFMKVECYRGVDENGKVKVYSKSINYDGSIKWIENEPFFEFSPFIGFNSNIAKAPLNVVPMLIDEAMNVVSEEKKAFKPEKRKDEKQWQFIIFIILAIVGAIGAGLFLLLK